MTLYFKTLQWKNLLSTGNQFTEVDFTSHKSTLVVGENGSGKSTFMDALSFALFGRAFRNINKPQLINSTNQKGLEVELTFDSNGSSYFIRRGLKPNYFEVYKNGSLVNVDASVRDYQEQFEQTVLKMNFKSFSQVVVLGSASYVPFMQLAAAARREVIEDLLDIQVFSTMNVLLKEKVSENKNEMLEVKYETDLLNNKLEDAEKHSAEIKRLKELEISKMKDKATHQLKDLKDAKQKLSKMETSLDGLLKLISDKKENKDQLTKFAQIEVTLKSKIDAIMKSSEFFNHHDNCPTCQQGIEHDFKQTKLTEFDSSTIELNNKLNILFEKKKQVENRLSEISDVEDEISRVNTSCSELKVSIRMLTNSLKSIKEELEKTEKEVDEIDQTHVTSLKDKLAMATKRVEALTEQRELLATAVTILKDGGIKTQIIKQYVPVINQLINKYLASLEFLVEFELDEQFNETIKSRFRDVFTYSSFSEGEKARINIALLLTFRAIARMRNSLHCNILILDEILDSATDHEGVELMAELLKSIDSNVFIISHSSKMHDKFDRTLQFQKIKGFSELVSG